MKTKTFIINKISVNRKTIDTVKVSYHVYESHPDITDDVILALVVELDGQVFEVDAIKPPFQYYVNLIDLDGKKYRLVWLLEDNKFYLELLTPIEIIERNRNEFSK